MFNFELYIGSSRLDLFGEQNVDLTDVIQDVREVDKIFTPYSTEIVVPASPEVNKLFKHYYRTDIVGGFDARIKQDAVINLNGFTWKKGKVKLNGVELKKGVPYSYRIVFYGDTVALKDILGDDELSSLDWLENFDTIYGLSSVKDYLQNARDVDLGQGGAYADAILTSLISAEDRLYYSTDGTDTLAGTGNLYPSGTIDRGVLFNNLKFSIRLDLIIKAIEQKYTVANGYPMDLVFSTDFFTNTNSQYADLYLWLHREKGKISFENSGGAITSTLATMPTVTLGGTVITPSAITQTGIPQIVDNANIGVELQVSSSAVTFDFIIEKDGVVFATYLANTGGTQYNFSFFTDTNSVYKFKVRTSEVFSVLNTSTIRVQTYDKPLDDQIDTTTAFSSSQSLTQDLQFKITENVPKIKVIDFLGGLFKMWNLTAYLQDGVIVVDTLNNFYLDGNTFNITEFVDNNTATVEPIKSFKTLELKFKGGKYFQVKKHTELFAKQYGELNYAESEKYVGGAYKLEVPFERMKYERLLDANNGNTTGVMYGWGADTVDAEGVPSGGIGEPVLHYANRVTSSTAIRIYEAGTRFDLTTYYIPSNTRTLADTDNILFNAEVNEWTGLVNPNTLFLNYYTPYIPDLFDISRRTLKIKAVLSLKILLKYRLNDVFIIGQESYYINSIKTNLKTRVSTLELVNKI